ncbi:MAG: cytochrome c oxidase cbb3-type subunit 3 [Myxococcota bacterium]|jgi:cytochrome c oxidase cbb3-type subunit 3
MSQMDQLLGHADDNDGIDEYDNPLPAWWVWLFGFTILWAIGYTADYHFIRPTSQEQAYAAELAAAAEQWPTREVAAADVAADPKSAEAGRAIYQTNCVACHGANLEGGIGPNLKDAEWIHGGSIEEVVRTISEGVPAKGMLAWGPILGPEKIAQVAAFVLSQGEGD